MSFLNTFIGLSILTEEQYQSDELNYHTSLLQEQSESINSLIRHQEEQDWIRDYIYRINKAIEKLEVTSNKDNLDYYYSIYCIAKGINDSGINTSSISELKDKEYFDNCLERISKLVFDFAKNHNENISEYNEHIQNLEEADIFEELKENEKIRYDIAQINEKVKGYEKVMKGKSLRSLVGFLPFGLILLADLYGRYLGDFIVLKNIETDDGYLPLFGTFMFLAIMIGKFIGSSWSKNVISKLDPPMTKKEYNGLITEKARDKMKLSNNNVLYEYASEIFPELDFSENGYISNANEILSAISEKEKDLMESRNLLEFPLYEIREKFYIYE